MNKCFITTTSIGPSFPFGLSKTGSDFIVRRIKMNAGDSCD